MATIRFLDDHPNVTFVRLLWLDYVSVLRGRILTVAHFRDLEEKGQYHGLGSLNMFQANNSAPDLYDGGDWGLGQSWLVPDRSSIQLQPGQDNHALIFCYFSDKRPMPLTLTVGDRCPRRVLQRAIQHAHSIIGNEFQVGFEIEFVCSPWLKSSQPTHEVSGIRTLEGHMMPILCEIVESLTQVGILVLHFHAEATDHQFEIALAPMDPMSAIDALVVARETIWKISHSHSTTVSFSPESPLTNGIHLNLSINGPTHDKEAYCSYFLAGVLAHLPALCALGLPHPSSYDRTAPSSWCVGRHVAWGTQNRLVPVRQRSAGFWEFRFLDDYCNFYLVLAAILHCGTSGVNSRLPLRIRDCQVDPAMLDDEGRRSYGIEEELPFGIEEACNAIRKDDMVVKALGDNLVSSFISVITRRARNF